MLRVLRTTCKNSTQNLHQIRSKSTQSHRNASNHKFAAILYHYPCPDGAFAALAAHLYFASTSQRVRYFPNSVSRPIRLNSLPIDDISDVYLLDFIGPPGFVADVSSKVESVTILDHHKTAIEALNGNSPVTKNVVKILDVNRSGATIAFDFFREKLLARTDISSEDGLAHFLTDEKNDKIRRLFSLIEDGDLWRWAIPDSQAFSSGLKDLGIEYSVRRNSALFNQLLALDPDNLITQGKETLAHKQKIIQEILEKSYVISLANGLFGNCLAVEADSVPYLRSELGHQLAVKSKELGLRGIGAIVYKSPDKNNNQLLKISLRSTKSEDTTPISQRYGGGGHRNASSFMLSSRLFDRWKLRTD